MKKNAYLLAGCLTAATLWSCSDNNNSNNSDRSDTTTNQTTVSPDAPSMNTTDSTDRMSANNANTMPSSTAPLGQQDSMFVMKAAMGNMMEIQAGQLAQQNGNHERVKAYASMMVNDHTKASQELMSMVQGRNVAIPQDLPADMKKHMTAMQKMQGKAFDNHYMSMMVNDHKKTLADFEKQAANGQDPQLKAWAQKMIPALQMHRDSAVAISKAKM